MERIIKIEGFSDKETKDNKGTFPCFDCLVDNQKTSIGVFEEDVVEQLKSHMFKWVKVVAPKRQNGYINITRFIALATKEEIPNFTEEAKPADAERITTPTTSRVEPSINTRVIHELIDNRIVYSKFEFGQASERHTIKYKDIEDFKQKYEEVVMARRAIDAKLNQDKD